MSGAPGSDTGRTRPADVAAHFWRIMASNRFDDLACVLADDFVLDWPQSGERIRGAANFARMNAEYPAHGPWRFTVHRIVGDEAQAASDVSVTDGVQSARAISFFTVNEGRISRMVEFWPDPFEAPASRTHLVERIA